MARVVRMPPAARMGLAAPTAHVAPPGNAAPRRKSTGRRSRAEIYGKHAAPKPSTTETQAGLLIKLIVSTIKPQCWTENGGSCTAEFFPTGMGLVVCAPPDVQEQVADLLDAVRKLQDVQVATEVKIVTATGGPAQEMLDRAAMSNVAAGQPLFLAPCQVARFMKALESDCHATVVQAPEGDLLQRPNVDGRL